ncbi:MAG: dockerin type I domain-containing protein [Bacteroidia bacterium]
MRLKAVVPPHSQLMYTFRMIGVRLFMALFSILGFQNSSAVSLGLGQVTGCIGDTVRVPLQSFTTVGNIAAISLRINYPNAALRYVGLENNILPGLGQTIANAPAPGGALYIGWYNIQPITLTSGSPVMLLTFVMLAPGTLVFDTSVCEIADGAGDVIPQVAYTSGGVSLLQGPAWVQQPPATLTIPPGGSATLGAQAVRADGYRWQRLLATGWTDLQNGTQYQGVTTAQLSITGAQLGLNGAVYRLRINNRCGQTAFSSSTTLSVAGNLPQINLGSMVACPGDTIRVPVNVVSAIPDISAVSLTLRFPVQQLQFIDFQDVIPGLNTTNLIINAPAGGNAIYLAWFSLTPITLPQGALVYFRFIVNGSATLVPDTSNSGCELANSAGDVVQTLFGNGQVTATAINAVIFPTDTLRPNSSCFSLSAPSGPYTYLWNTGDTSRSIQVTGSGWYSCAVIQGQCRVDDSVYVVMPSSPPALGLQMPLFCVNSEVLVAVDVSNVSHFGALSMVLQYDTSRLQYLAIQDVHPQLQGSNLVYNNNQDRFYLAWFNILSFIPSSSTSRLFNLRFRVRSAGSGRIDWVSSLTEIADSVGNVLGCPALTGGSFVTQTCGGLGGQLRYLNSAQTPMTNTTLQLWQGQQLRYSAPVQSNGTYDIPQTDPGVYTLKIQTAKPWGGVNATDALFVSRHFTNLITLTGLNFKAADVNGSTQLNSTDALNISRRFAVLVNSYSVGDWALGQDSVVLGTSGNRDSLNINVLCYGDVNGSYQPPTNARLQSRAYTGHSVLLESMRPDLGTGVLLFDSHQKWSRKRLLITDKTHQLIQNNQNNFTEFQ